MATIRGIEGMTPQQLSAEVAAGGRFVVFQYCISFIILSLKQSSDIRFVRAGGDAGNGLPFTLVSLFFGWWGIPWGPIYTVQTIARNSKGGTDVTADVMAQLNIPTAPYASYAPGYSQPQQYPQYPQQPPYGQPQEQYPQYPQQPYPQPQYPPQPPQYPPRQQ